MLIGVTIVVATLLISRRARDRSRSGARTVELLIDPAGVTRRMEDGRAEGAAWAELTEIEVVHTPVATADGARVFVVLAESEERGCLVPLGVGYDADLLTELSRLPGFSIRDFERELDSKKNGRRVLWTRQGVGGADSTEGTGSN